MIGRLWRRSPVAFVAFVLGLVITVFFAVRTATFTIYWSDPAHRDQTIEPWMTAQYVAYSYHLPVEEVRRAWQLPHDVPNRTTAAKIAARRGWTLDELGSRVRAAAAEFRVTNP